MKSTETPKANKKTTNNLLRLSSSNAEKTMHNKERSIGLIDEAEPEQLIEKIEIEGTPFNIIKINNEYFGTFGKYRITEVNEQEETVRKQLIEYSWNNIVKIMTLVVDMLNPKTE